ncbi:MAG: nuclear transport factor 2 family protein [Blastocatellales bacterium]
MSDTTNNRGEYEAIANTLQQYINGGKSGRGGDMKPAFHADATIHGYLGPDLIAGPIQILYDWVDQNEPATRLQSWIAGIDLNDTVATARLELYNWSGHRFTDLFTLLKVEGEWKIISKVFYLHP